MPIVSITLPQLGESVAEATILKWLVEPGDTIERDQIIAEVATDKVDTDLYSEYEGVLSTIEVKEGEIALVGSTIATITTSKSIELEKVVPQEGKSISKSPATQEKDQNKEQVQSILNSTSLYLTPVVRNIAAKAKLTPQQLEQIPRSGSNHSRITKKDILAYLNTPTKSAEVIQERKILKIEEEDEVYSLSRMRQLIAKHVSESVQTAAHVTSWVISDVTSIVRWRENVKVEFQENYNSKLTYTHIFMALVVESLQQFPKLNAWFDGVDQLVLKKRINLGFATATPDNNLIVPNLKSAEGLTFSDFAKEVNRLGQAAKSNSLDRTDIQGTTFIVSNTGIFGSLMGTPILVLPQVAILALGAIESAPGVVIEDGKEKIAIVKQMHLSLSYDHRIIDGAYASGFLSDLKRRMLEFEGIQF